MLIKAVSLNQMKSNSKSFKTSGLKIRLSVVLSFKLRTTYRCMFLTAIWKIQLRNKRHKIAVSSDAILADLLLNLAGFYQRLAGVLINKLLTKNIFQHFFKMKAFTPSSSKNVQYFSPLWRFFIWVTPGQRTTSWLQLFGIFIMMQRSR